MQSLAAIVVASLAGWMLLRGIVRLSLVIVLVAVCFVFTFVVVRGVLLAIV